MGGPRLVAGGGLQLTQSKSKAFLHGRVLTGLSPSALQDPMEASAKPHLPLPRCFMELKSWKSWGWATGGWQSQVLSQIVNGKIEGHGHLASSKGSVQSFQVTAKPYCEMNLTAFAL